MPELTVAEARALHVANPNFFRGAVDFGGPDHTIAAALTASIFKTYPNPRWVSCFDCAFDNHHALSPTKHRLLGWAQENAFVYLPPGHAAGHIEVWGANDDSLAHACRLVAVGNPRADDLWVSAMGFGGEPLVTHYRNSFAGGGYGVPIASFVHFANWNAGWMQNGAPYVGDVAQWR